MIIVLYNTCGLSGNNNTYFWIQCINNILKQEVDIDFRVVLSDCCSPVSWRNELHSCLGNSIDYVYYDDILPLNRTVNLTARKYPNADYYLYLDSGIDFENQTNVVKKLCDEMTKDIAMIAAQVNSDHGYDLWNVKPGIIDLGKTVNLHCQLFSGEYFREYNGILPDIFASDSSESTFTFLCAAINKKFVLSSNVKVSHEAYLDGASSGFKRGCKLWKSKKTIKQLCKEGYLLGFGYEEFYDPITGNGRISMHNYELYENNKLKNPEKLKNWMKGNLFHNSDI